MERFHASQIEGAAEGGGGGALRQAWRAAKSSLKGASREMVKSMSEKELAEFAGGSRKDKLERVGDRD
jgi:hypothetical protein